MIKRLKKQRMPSGPTGIYVLRLLRLNSSHKYYQEQLIRNYYYYERPQKSVAVRSKMWLGSKPKFELPFYDVDKGCREIK